MCVCVCVCVCVHVSSVCSITKTIEQTIVSSIIFIFYFLQLIFALLGNACTARTSIGLAVIAADHGSTVLVLS